MKVFFKSIILGVFSIVLFAQMSFKHNKLVGEYLMSFDYISSKLILKANFKFENKIKDCTRSVVYKGNWSVDDENVILIYKKRYNREPDTLKMKQLGSNVDSLGRFKKI